MAIIKPFRGLRPNKESAAQVASPPYDVLSSAEAKELILKNPNSFLRVNKAEIDFDSKVDPYSQEVYQRGSDNLKKLIDDKLMTRDENESFYLYRLTWLNQSQTGLVALTSVAEYDAGKIKKHEHTRPVKVKDRANHISALKAHVGPVFSTFRYSPSISDLFDKIKTDSPTIAFDAEDGVKHELWVVDNQEQISSLIVAFAELDALYIADGHHRSEAASEVCRRENGSENASYFLNVLFSDNELRILPYNRVVKDLGALSLKDVLTKAEEHFTIAKSDSPVEPTTVHQFGLYCENQWYLLTAREGSFELNDPTESIDAAILSKNLLSPILGIKDIRADKRIDFVGGIRGVQELERLVDSGIQKIAFSLYATTIDQLLSVADAGQVMPPKSTWFEPKLRSGMVVNLLTE